MSRSALRACAVLALAPRAWSAEPAEAAAPSLRGLGNASRSARAGPKELSTPGEFLGQLTWNAQASHTACSEDVYQLPGTLFGLIKHMGGTDDSNFYPTDKAVAWASGSGGLVKDLQDCCGKDAKQCLCNIAKNVGLLDPSNNLYTGAGKYSFIAFSGAVGAATGGDGSAVVSPTWANLAEVLPTTYDWVFSNMKLTELAVARLQDVATCGLASTMQTLQAISGQYELGTPQAYEHVFNTYMSPKCSSSYCPCKGVGDDGDHCDALCKDGYCGDAAVELFCGEGGAAACDPSQFLCKRTDGSEVGYVRAYLHMFLDCVEVFQGNGCSQGSRSSGTCVEEYIVLPNPEIQKEIQQGSAATKVLVSDMPAQCTPDN